eukprot:Sspe_Gene.76336::Locus_47696_Transcript_1_1_Confidence_1.000_Length_723::g.76336::m.76336
MAADLAPKAPEGCAAVELFLDLDCPFSAKMFSTVYGSVEPAVKTRKIAFFFNPVPQPWHPQSCVMAEAFLAVQAIAPAKVLNFARLVFEAREAKYVDRVTKDKSRIQLYHELAVEAEAAGVGKDDFLQKLSISDEGGTAVTPALKKAVKYHRISKVHVTPTVFINGKEADISSSASQEQWMKLLSNF